LALNRPHTSFPTPPDRRRRRCTASKDAPPPSLPPSYDELEAILRASTRREADFKLNVPSDYDPYIRPPEVLPPYKRSREDALLALEKYHGLYAPPLKGWRQISEFFGMATATFRRRHGKELQALGVVFDAQQSDKAGVRQWAWPSELILWTAWKARRGELI
jgi:hypothetical protein